ncbi:hypothetical protein [Neobacillus niacini]|uniref:hypothetical protein n=1 Tax=Neobacillus niacini TaxID=86668 RepID=UPI00398310AC
MSRENNTNNLREIKSLEILWNQSIQKLDVWNDRAKYQEEVLLTSVENLVEAVKRNQDNAKELIEQFTKEQLECETKARNELFSYFTSLSQLFLNLSYFDINQNFDYFKNKVLELSKQPVEKLSRPEFLENLIKSTQKYVEVRRRSRERLIERLKENAMTIHNSQQILITLLSMPIKNVLFPLSKYIVKPRNVTNKI